MQNKKEIISYLFFGLLTTLVSILTYQLFSLVFGEEVYLINNILSWIIAVCFAFFTNKLWVFSSKDWDKKILKKEAYSFFLARVFSLILEEIGLFVLIDLLMLKTFELQISGVLLTGVLLSKVIMQVVVVLTNYFLSKFVIFKKG